jgi:zinc transporter 1
MESYYSVWALASSCNPSSGLFLCKVSISSANIAIGDANSIQEVENPKLVLIMGCVGFGLNLISVLFLHGMIDLCAIPLSGA